MSILNSKAVTVNENTPFEKVVTITPEQELHNRILELRQHYASKKRKATVTLVGQPYEYEHFQGKALVQDYRLSTGARVYSEFVISEPTA